MTTNISSVKGYVLSLTLSAWMYLTTMLHFRRKSTPQYVGPKVVAIDRYSRPTMRHMSGVSALYHQMPSTQAMLNRMEPELHGAMADPDTGSEDKRWPQLPWFPKPQPDIC